MNSKNKDEIKELICPEEYLVERPGISYRNIEHITYPSKTTGRERGANILYPSHYDPDKKYPVMYILHGMFGYEGMMLYEEDCKIPEILGNMSLDGVANEVIAVFANIYASKDPELQPGFSPESLAPYHNFINDLVADLIPYIEEHFPVYTDRDHRAIFGFSFGGREAIYIGMVRSDLFNAIASISAGPGLLPAKDWAMEHPGIFTKEEMVIQNSDYPLDLFLMCRGSKDSVVGKFPVEYHDVFEQNGVEHLWYEIPNAEHGGTAIQSGLYNFMLRWQE